MISNRHEFLYSKQNGGQWLKCADAVVSDHGGDEKEIMDTLLGIGLPIVEVPSSQWSVLQKASRPPTKLSSGLHCVLSLLWRHSVFEPLLTLSIFKQDISGTGCGRK